MLKDLRAHLVEHAHATGAVSFTRLLSDSGFLAWAEPAALTPLLGDATDICRDIVRVYRRASTQLGTDAAVNAAVLQESALVLHGQPMFSGGSEIEPRYSTDLVSTTVDNSILTLTHGDQHESIGPIAFGTGPDGRLLLASNGHHVLRLWDVRTGRPVGRPLECDGSVVAVGFAADGRLLVASRGRGDTLRIRQAGDTRDLTRITIDGARFVSAAVLGTAPDGQLVLVVATDSTVQVRNIATGEPVGPLLAGETMHMEAVACATTRKGRLLVAAGRARQVRIWDAGTGRLVGGHNGGPTAPRDIAAADVAFRLCDSVGTPECTFRGSIARPARAPVNASPPPSQTTTHDSGPPWVATPST